MTRVNLTPFLFWYALNICSNDLIGFLLKLFNLLPSLIGYIFISILLQKEAALTESTKQKAFLYELCLSCCQGDSSHEDLDRVMSPDLHRKMWLYRIQERVQVTEVNTCE